MFPPAAGAAPRRRIPAPPRRTGSRRPPGCRGARCPEGCAGTRPGRPVRVAMRPCPRQGSGTGSRVGVRLLLTDGREQLLGPPLANDVDRTTVAQERIEAEEPFLCRLGLVEAQERGHDQLEQVEPLCVVRIDPLSAPPAAHLSRADAERGGEFSLRMEVLAQGLHLEGCGNGHGRSVAQHKVLRQRVLLLAANMHIQLACRGSCFWSLLTRTNDSVAGVDRLAGDVRYEGPPPLQSARPALTHT